MATKEDLLAALQAPMQFIATLDIGAPDAAQRLETAFPIDGPAMKQLRALVREGVEARWLCDRENAGVRYSRVIKAASPSALSVDAVHMQGPGASHVHPQGEVDLCFAVSGSPRFDGQPAGWTVYGKQSWHVPTVEGGVMDILYFLPGGAMAFGPCPPDATPVGLQKKT